MLIKLSPEIIAYLKEGHVTIEKLRTKMYQNQDSLNYLQELLDLSMLMGALEVTIQYLEGEQSA